MLVDKSFWRGKRVIITGHTGFKGAWFSLWLHALGADVVGISLAPKTKPNLFDSAEIGAVIKSHFCNILDAPRLREVLGDFQPDFIFHLAAQALVLESYKNPINTFETNVIGTANILECSRVLKSKPTVVCITTDKVYQNNEWNYPYRETDALGGRDPYSASKSASEMIISSYRDSFLEELGIRVCVARAGNVIGGGDWAENRLIPDAIRAWDAGISLELRKPDATRPWQHVLEPLAGYLLLGQIYSAGLCESNIFNFGPDPHESASVRRVIKVARDEYGKGVVLFGDANNQHHEATQLNLDISKARAELGFNPKWCLEEAIRRTMNWYSLFASGRSARELCLSDIEDYMDKNEI